MGRGKREGMIRMNIKREERGNGWKGKGREDKHKEGNGREGVISEGKGREENLRGVK